METLFSFELLVDHIYLEESEVREVGALAELAVALRLLDFPTLVIHQPEHAAAPGHGGQHVFNRGKACFFRMNLDSLHGYLWHTPLYATVLDVSGDGPRLVGSACVSLAKAMDRIRRDMTERGAAAPSSHGQRGTVRISNLRGETVGRISLSYKLLSLGRSLLDLKHTDGRENDKKEADESCAESENVQQSKPDEGIMKPQSKEATKQEMFSSECQETDMSVFCPPHLYYNNCVEVRAKYEDEGCKHLRSNMGPVAVEGTDKNVEQKQNGTSSVREQQEVSSNTLGQALHQLPLLNALLLELSQLNRPNVDQPLSVHPNLAWIYRPDASTEMPIAERNMPGNTSQTPHQESKNRQTASVRLTALHSPRCCSTPKQPTQRERKKLVFGTTKTFNLRLKRNRPATERQRECEGLTKGRTQVNTSSKVVEQKSAKRSTKRSTVTETIERMPQETHVDGEKPSASPPWLVDSPSRVIHVAADVRSHKSTSINQSSPQSHAGKPSDSWASDRSGGEDDYADDFNSFEPSNPSSPSPELHRATTLDRSSDLDRPSNPGRPLEPGRSSDSGPERVIPVPIKASRSPQRSLRGTYTIRRQTFGVSFSSEDRDRAESRLSPSSGEQEADSSRQTKSSEGSVRSTDGRWSEADKRRRSDSSFEVKPEEDDELGTLDFIKGYKHISELVAHKLPGYTM